MYLLSIESKSFLDDFNKHLKKCKNEGIGKGRFGYIGEIKPYKNTKNEFLIDEVEYEKLIWELSNVFNQSIQATCQFGDVVLVNENGKHNKDTKFTHPVGCEPRQVWFNACLSTRISDFSRSF